MVIGHAIVEQVFCGHGTHIMFSTRPCPYFSQTEGKDGEVAHHAFRNQELWQSLAQNQHMYSSRRVLAIGSACFDRLSIFGPVLRGQASNFREIGNFSTLPSPYKYKNCKQQRFDADIQSKNYFCNRSCETQEYFPGPDFHNKDCFQIQFWRFRKSPLGQYLPQRREIAPRVFDQPA